MDRGWHILRDAGAMTLARRLPVRWDVAVRAEFPPVRMGPLLHQIRQDLWRSLQRQRGYAPVVRAEQSPSGLIVTAGGQIDGVFDRAGIEARIATLLRHPERRTRWVRVASAGAGPTSTVSDGTQT